MSAAVLETARLRLRPLAPDDADRLLEIFADPVAMRHYPSTRDRDEALHWIRWNLDLYARHGHGLWAAELRDTGEFAGQAGLVPQEVDGTQEIEIGYLFRRAHWGRGLASEAAAACRDHGLGALGARRLISLIDPYNRPSRRVAERVGMHLERAIVKWWKPVCLYALDGESALRSGGGCASSSSEASAPR